VTAGASERRRVLISAYSCAPGGGSEDGVGWTWARAAAVDHDVWVMTRENNAPAIEAALGPEDRVHFHPVYLDLPRWSRFWKKGLRGHRLYYSLWQLLVRRRSSAVIQANGIELTHHLTFASDSLPAGIVGAGGVPSIWGPVGGAQTLPAGFEQWVGDRGARVERFRTVWLGLLRRWFGDRAARKATLTVALNRNVAERFAVSARDIVQRPNVAVDPCEVRPHRRTRESAEHPVAVFAGRLIPWKGLRIAVAALAEPPAAAWHLDVYGEGPDREPALALAGELGVADRVTFHGRIDRAELLRRLADADALIHPAMHDSSPWSVGEALSLGTPVVCLDHGGPPDIVGDDGGVAVGLTEDVAAGFARGLEAVRGRRVPIDGRWSTERLPAVISEWYERCLEAGAT
jgi:glycosyltransferase involved in cell wall biosynthesis